MHSPERLNFHQKKKEGEEEKKKKKERKSHPINSVFDKRVEHGKLYHVLFNPN